MSPARFSRRLILAAAGGAAALSLAACGGSGSSTPATVPADADVVVRALDGVVWDKDAYTATAENGEVTIYSVNDSGIAHNLHVQTADGTGIGDFIDLPARGSDGTKTWKLEPGDYRIVCLIPGHQNMDSLLTVS
jgi:plastocyanin